MRDKVTWPVTPLQKPKSCIFSKQQDLRQNSNLLTVRYTCTESELKKKLNHSYKHVLALHMSKFA